MNATELVKRLRVFPATYDTLDECVQHIMDGERYAEELDEAASILGLIHPIGEIKAIGRLEVTEALKQVIDANGIKRWKSQLSSND